MTDKMNESKLDTHLVQKETLETSTEKKLPVIDMFSTPTKILYKSTTSVVKVSNMK